MDAEEAIAALNAKGVAVTAEEMAEIAKSIPAGDEELSEDALDDVAGGGVAVAVSMWLVKAGYRDGKWVATTFKKYYG